MNIRLLTIGAIMVASLATAAIAMNARECHEDCDNHVDDMAQSSNSGAASKYDAQCHALCDDLGNEQGAFRDCVQDPTQERQDCIDAYNADRPDFSVLNPSD